jgi:hypothetical protein
MTDKPKSKSNIDIIGVGSIRLNGQLIEDLPIAERAAALPQLPLAHDAERQNNIEAVLARYPKQKIEAISARIKEAQDNIDRISNMRAAQQEMINNYNHIKNMCKLRDKELSFYPDEGDERNEKIREWNIQLANANTAAYMVYEDASKFDEQIAQCEDAILKAEDVLERERNDIRNMEKLSGQIIARDVELKRLGVVKKL